MRQTTMRAAFQKWLFLSVAIIFLVTFTLSFRFQTNRAKQNARELMKLKVNDTIQNIEVHRRNWNAVNEIVESDARATLAAFNELLLLDPSILENRDRLKEIANLLDVDELVVSDEKGILVAAVSEETIGYDMNSQDQSRPFMEGVTNPDFFLYQEPKMRGFDRKIYQYVGAARKDKPGIVQFGDSPDWYYMIADVTDIKNLASGFRIGARGQIFIAEKGMIVSIDNPDWVDKPLKDFGIPEESFDKEEGSFRCTLPSGRLLSVMDDARLSEVKKSATTIDVLCLYRRFGDYVIVGMLPEDEMYFLRNNIIRELIMTHLVLFLVVFALVSWLVDRIVIRGILRVNKSLSKITAGDLEEKVGVLTNQEFVSLSEGINSTVGALKNAIAETKSRINKELEFARAIQQAALPSLVPYPFEDRKSFRFFATMDTAKEVGGDFYDFLLIDDDHLEIVIADVSGKGIPASLFMMKSKAVLRVESEKRFETDEIIQRANHELSENNASGMFVTTFLGILELSTGKFTATNAGHNAPILIPQNGKPEYLNVKGGVILGAFEGADYEKSEIILRPGDRIYFYTDGVSEALNRAEELFGEERLLKIFDSEEATRLSPEPLLQFVRERLMEFTQGAPQSDDITMMVLEYRGKE